MYYIKNDSINPYFNHALEEYFLKNFEEECFILWRNEPCILIGRNQNTLAEINPEYVRKNEIKVVRRLTGGGAVFNDLGNINFTFITNLEGLEDSSFRKFAQPVIEALEKLDVRAEFSGRNDITIDGRKFSGNARYYYKKRLLHHGTILFSGNLTNLNDALRIKPIKYRDKAVKSVKNRVTNISEHLAEKMDVLQFRDFLMKSIMDKYGIKSCYDFSEEDYRRIDEIRKNRFESYEWNYGSSPEYAFSNEERFPCGTIEVRTDIRDGSIRNIKFFGDFFGKKEISELELSLCGVKYEKNEIEKILNEINLDDYIQGMRTEDVTEKLLSM